MIVPEGFFNAGDKANGQGVIGPWACHKDLSITKLWIPNTITSIGNNAFKECANLSAIIFENGESVPLSIGLMSFANCASLRKVSLPARTKVIGKGCFRDCIALEDIEIGNGRSLLNLSDHLFDNCPGRVAMEETLANEAERRSALMPHKDKTYAHAKKLKVNEVLESMRAVMPKDKLSNEKIKEGLESVYELVCADSDFSFEKYYKDYQRSCEYFAGIKDWSSTDNNTIKSLLAGSFAQKVAGIDKGSIPKEQLEKLTQANLDKIREICKFISCLQGVDVDKEQSKVLEYKLQFCNLFTDMSHHAAYYRIIAAIRPDLVVNIAVAAKLSAVYAWLMGIDLPNGDIEDWYKMSLGVRKKLQEFLPDKTIYQVGAFSWHIADAFRADKELNDTQKKCKCKVLERLREVGLLAKNS